MVLQDYRLRQVTLIYKFFFNIYRLRCTIGQASKLGIKKISEC